MSELQVRKVVAAYDASPVLHGVTFTVASGTLAAVLGPSGSGKSTLLRVIAGLHRPLEGAIVASGRVLSGPRVDVPPQQRRIGLVPQDAALFPHLDVRANVGYGLPRRERGGPRVDELLDLVGLAGFASRMPGELSGGQRHRVALARALAPKPDVVMLDEPFSALDASLRGEVRAQVRQVLRSTGTTAVLVTHDQDEALSMADQVIVLAEGRLEQDGTPAEVYAQPRSPWVARFVGGAVTLHGVWRDGTAECALGTVPAELGIGQTAAPGDPVELVVRPEHLGIDVLGAGPASAAGGVPSMVRHVQYFGHDAVVTLDLPGLEEPIDARVIGGTEVRPDSEVAVSLHHPALAFSQAAEPSPRASADAGAAPA